ncbi:hypothetical protein MTR_0102s0030 [Medicago truncatula]|uniref:Uncharacterized protein n=1 Tax=Medicago truncatula TaxID=3880 RepID=A0A072TT62_MEDTR|nr:hypothetical protein MTR_0102s0030 [Medicago truncatula]
MCSALFFLNHGFVPLGFPGKWMDWMDMDLMDHIATPSATSALTESTMDWGSKTVKESKHRGLFCI